MRTPPWIVALLLVVALVPLGSAPTWAEYSLVAITCCTFLALMFRAASDPAAVHAAEYSPLDGLDTYALIALPTLALVQIVAFATAFHTDGALIDVVRASLVLLATVLFYVLVHSAVVDYRSFRSIVSIFTIVGVAEAVYGLFNLLAGNEQLLLMQRWAYHDSATGTLVGRNHFALLMELCLPLAVIISATAPVTRRNTPAPTSEDFARRMILASATIVMGLALVFSRSRMGVLSFLLALFVVLPTAHLMRPAETSSSRRTRGQLIVPAMSLGLVVVYVLVIGVTPAFERFANIATDLETGRIPIWQAAAAMAMDKPLLGHGWGAFDSLVDGYKGLPTGFSTRYAHNDYLQVFAEAGVFGLAIVAWLVYRLTRRYLQTLARPLTPDARTVIIWLGVTVSAALIHSIADFGLRIPGVGFMFAGIVAVLVRVMQEPQLAVRPRRRHRSSRR